MKRKPRMHVPLEKDVLRQCLDWLTLQPVYCWRNNSGGAKLAGHGGRGQFVRFGKPGSSDILGIFKAGTRCPGRFLAVEVKRPGGELTELQQAFLDNVVEAGGYAICVCDVRELIEALTPILE